MMSENCYQPRYTIPAIDAVIQALNGRVTGVHEACLSVPEIGPRDFDELVDSIEADGLLRAIEVDSEQRLLDGRCRLQACYVLGIELSECDIVTVGHDPWIIARTNFARRHLTDDQKAMHAVCVLKEERAKAAERKRLGAEKGRNSKSRSLGAAAAPSGKKPQSRARRASDIASDKTGVPRQQIETAEQIVDAKPELYHSVVNGEKSLAEAAATAGVAVPKKRATSKKQAKPTALPQQAPSKLAEGAVSVWQDKHSDVTMFADDVRCHRCGNASMIVNTKLEKTGFVFLDDGDWCWVVLPSNGEAECVETRADAEVAVLERMQTEDIQGPRGTKKPKPR